MTEKSSGRRRTKKAPPAQGLFVHPKDVAAFYGVSVETAQGWCKRGLIPAQKLGRSYFISKHWWLEHVSKGGQP
jgi:Helix-turn-helix domain